MPRLLPIDPASATGRVKEIFEGPLKGKAFNIFKSMANSPAALDVYLAMSGALAKSHLSAKEREVIQLAIGEANHCEYCTAAHTAIGLASGLTREQTIEARKGAMQDAQLNTLAKFVLKVNEKKGFVSDADLQAMHSAGYTNAHIADAVACVALAIYTNYFNHVNDTPSDFPTAPALT
jgi:uncharacterized peroxidase-related enzyme